MDLSWVKSDKRQDSNLASVVEVKEGVGVKIHIEGEENPRDTYYQSLVIPQVGDRVYFVRDCGSIIIQGSFKF